MMSLVIFAPSFAHEKSIYFLKICFLLNFVTFIRLHLKKKKNLKKTKKISKKQKKCSDDLQLTVFCGGGSHGNLRKEIKGND